MQPFSPGVHSNQNTVKSIASKHAVLQAQKNHEANSAFPLTPSQKNAMIHFLTTTDRFNAIQGYAGTGKTTMLKLTTEIAQAKGFRVRGLAVTSSAANELAVKAGIHADVFPVVHHEILNATEGSLASTLFILDEASLLSTAQGHELIKLVESRGARLYLVGDDAQLPGVKAGRIFGLTQDYGIKTATMTDIIRQRGEIERASVEDAIREDIHDSLKKISQVRTFDTHEERIQAMAQGFLSLTPHLREQTLLFAPTHANRRAITDLIREGLKTEGRLAEGGITLTVLKARPLEERRL